MMKRIVRWLQLLVQSEKSSQNSEVEHETLQQVSERLQATFADHLDFLARSIHLAEPANRTMEMCYFSSLTDDKFIREQIAERLLQVHTWMELQQSLATVTTVKETTKFSDMTAALNDGYLVLMDQDEQTAMLVHAPRNLSRGIEEPVNEFVSRGPRDSFSEDIQLNVGLIRKRLKGVDLVARRYVLGDYTRTTCTLLFLQNITAPHLIERIEDKLRNIRTDAIFDSGQLEELLVNHPLSPFDEFMNTERADKVAAELLDGRIALLVDGSPTALIGPATFFNLLSSPDDYYQRFISATIHRFLRFGGFMLSAHLSAVYLSLLTYHAHLIPVKLVEVLMSKREQVPFPPLFEILIMQIMIDLILEAIIRLPTKLGQIIGVAGAIIIGQAAISANLISPGVIIVVAITSISGFAMPRLSTSYSLQVLRYANLILASLFGGYGLIVSIMFWLIQLCHLHPLGKAYLSPLSPFNLREMRDMIVRLPKQRSRSR
jgi:spore germination protein KA